MSDKCSNENCLKNGSNRCSKCKEAFYCSKECQKIHWKLHKVNCTTSSTQSRDIEAENLSSNNASYSLAHDYFMFQTMSRLMLGGKFPVAQEYRKAYSLEFEHFQRIQNEEMVYQICCIQEEKNMPLFKDEDFCSENFLRRWGKVALFEEERLNKFLRKKDLKHGDIYIKKFFPQYNGLQYQTMRNAAMADVKYEFGNTYIDFGYVDLFQLIWGCYKNEETEILTFYGYDMSRVTNLRSKIIYLMLKLNDAAYSTNSILQVWFSSCWDSATLESFQKCVNYLIKNYVENNICKEDMEILKTWQKTKITSDTAKNKFSEIMGNAQFDDIWRMKKIKDQVKFARYLFTGCIFVSEVKTVCGNTTMFSTINGVEKATEELFFKAIDLAAIDLAGKNTLYDSLFELIESITTQKTMKFRSLIKSGNIICHLKTKMINPKDREFACFIKSLRPHTIDWSNVPDYMEKTTFIKFAEACSVKDTFHQLHFINWSNYVFGTTHIDWMDNREKLEEMYRKFKKQWQRDKAKMTSKTARVKYPSEFFLNNESYVNPLNGSCIMLSSSYRNCFEDFFLSDANGKPLNRLHCNVVDAVKSSFFDQCPYMFHAFFTFNHQMNIQS